METNLKMQTEKEAQPEYSYPELDSSSCPKWAEVLCTTEFYDNPLRRIKNGEESFFGIEVADFTLEVGATLRERVHFLWFDSNRYNVSALSQIIQSIHVKGAAVPIVQINKHHLCDIKVLLDIGALGIAATGLETPKEVSDFVKATKFPPLGNRGIGPGFSTKHLADVTSAVKKANQSIMTILVIDSHNSLLNILSMSENSHLDSGLNLILFDIPKLFGSSQSAEDPGIFNSFVRAIASLKRAEIPLGARITPAYSSKWLSKNLIANGATNQITNGFRFFLLGTELDLLHLAITPIKSFSFKEEVAIGSLLTGSSVETAKILSRKSHFLWIDAEHNPFSPSQVSQLAEAALKEGALPIVRVTQFNHPDISAYIRSGAKGIICPGVNSRKEAEQFIETVKSTDPETMAIVMIETRDGLRNSEAIVSVPGIEWLQIGPYDLALSLNVELGSLEHKNAISQIEDVARTQKLPLGGLVNDRSKTPEMQALGYRFLLVGSDQEFVRNGLELAKTLDTKSPGE